ncbi:MAG TPA: site-specific integrase [Terriglobales bacterium]|jgi:integrase/recombinase XerD|nr:site-specific integrase [Terriglobales bacterium]
MSETPTDAELKDMVMRMREKGLKATGCNSAIQAINVYLKWSGSALRVAKLKEPQRILPTFTLPQVSQLIHWKPKGVYHRRLHLLSLVLLDTGCRISEVLNLHVQDVDLDNLLLTVTGKGSKQRKVPISFELRKDLARHIVDSESRSHDLVFCTRRGRLLDRHIMLRDVKLLCGRLGFDPPERTLHAFRHTFAVNYLRKGGSVFHLQRVLGHSSLEMTRRYVNLTTADLSEMHSRVSLLA